jgi:hypothetical protein
MVESCEVDGLSFVLLVTACNGLQMQCCLQPRVMGTSAIVPCSQSAVDACIVGAAIKYVGASRSSWIFIWSCVRNEWELILSTRTVRHVNKKRVVNQNLNPLFIDDKKFDCLFHETSSVWKIVAYAFLMRLSFLLSRVTIFKSERETKIITQ